MTQPARRTEPNDEGAARARVAAAVRRLGGARNELGAVLVKHLVAEITVLPQEDDMLALLADAADESVAGGMYVLEQGIDPRSMGAPQAALQYARRLAQRGVSVSALLRAYRLGSSLFVELMLADLAAHPDADGVAAANVVMLRTTTAYVDTVSELLVEAYEIELESWSRQHSMARAARINALLSGRDVEVAETERELGYRLRGNHLAALMWFDESARGVDLMKLEQLAAHVAAVHGAGHLLLPTDEAGATLWITVPEDAEDLSEVIAAFRPKHGPAPRVALGSPAFGVSGFRTTHRQAQEARAVAMIAGRRAAAVTTAAEVGAVGLLCGNLEATRAWVVDTLGGLAIDDENTERLRETVRIFLHLGSSHTAAAEALHLHKNTVQYRITKAEAARGRAIRTDRADVELALRACHLLGPAVLRTS